MKNLGSIIRSGLYAAAIMAALPVIALTQPSLEGRLMELPPPPPPVHMGGETSEKSIIVDAGVNVSLCVTQGDLKVNGWNRKEVRVLVKNGSKFNIKVTQKDPRTSDPVWIVLSGLEKTKGKYPVATECIWGEEIEIDAPTAATVNIKGQETTTTIDTLKKANVKNIGGDITMRNITDGITALTYEGDVTVEESAGAMTLESTTGNILVFEASPSEIGDIFKAKTNSGAISLQRLQHRQIEVNSISGSIAFNGTILPGGTYGLSTTNGSIRMSIPATSSFRISASYGFGNFSSELPIKLLTVDVHPGPVKSLNGILGSGEATLKLTTNSGLIGIKKQ